MQTTTSTLTSLFDPVWGDEAHTYIDCKITMSSYGDEVLPFTANQNDPEAHGRKIYNDLISGVYGPIAEYVPVEVTAENTGIISVVAL